MPRSFRVPNGSGIKKLLAIICIFLPFLASAAGQQTIAASPRNSSWKAAVEAAAPGSVVVFEAGAYHDCGVTLNSGRSLQLAEIADLTHLLASALSFCCRGSVVPLQNAGARTTWIRHLLTTGPIAQE
jgi:hypothetical protein